MLNGLQDLYHQVPNPNGSILRSIQQKYQDWTGFSPPLFYGRGIVNYDFGLMPQRAEIASVGKLNGFNLKTNFLVGTPIKCQKQANPTQEYIDEIHSKYTAELQRIYDKYKDEFSPNRKKDLTIVE
jgi:2-acylglycerol O-acyltransferase 2